MVTAAATATATAATCSVSAPWFGHLQRGAKDVEGRLDRGTFAGLKKGQRLIVSGDGGSFAARVVDVRRYGSFRDYLVFEGLRRTLPGVSTVAEGVRVYRKFYTAAQEREHGVVAVQVQTEAVSGRRP